MQDIINKQMERHAEQIQRRRQGWETEKEGAMDIAQGAGQDLWSTYQGLMEQYRETAPQAPGAPTPGALGQYGQMASDLASRSGALQAGHMMQGMGGMNPAARAGAMTQISQGAMAPGAQAGLQGMGMGGDLLQQAAMARYGGAMGMAGDIFGGGMQAGMGGLQANLAGLDSRMMLEMLRRQQLQQREMAQWQAQWQEKQNEAGFWDYLSAGIGMIPGIDALSGLFGLLSK